MTGTGSSRPALQPWPRWILFGWMGIVIVLAAMLVGSNADSEWRDLVVVVTLMFVAFSFVILAVTWAMARFLLSDPAPRTLVALFGPPAIMALFILVIQIM